MRRVQAAAMIAGAFALGSCVMNDLPASGGSCAGGAAETLQGIEWETVQVVDVRVRQDDWTPMVLALVRDRPYVVRLSNGDDTHHGFSASDFFQSVAVESVTLNGEALADTCITSVGLPAGAVAEIRLVALRDGNYGFNTSGFLDLGFGLGSGPGIGAIYVY